MGDISFAQLPYMIIVDKKRLPETSYLLSVIEITRPISIVPPALMVVCCIAFQGINPPATKSSTAMLLVA
jgi:hypothetical protein